MQRFLCFVFLASDRMRVTHKRQVYGKASRKSKPLVILGDSFLQCSLILKSHPEVTVRQSVIRIHDYGLLGLLYRLVILTRQTENPSPNCDDGKRERVELLRLMHLLHCLAHPSHCGHINTAPKVDGGVVGV